MKWPLVKVFQLKTNYLLSCTTIALLLIALSACNSSSQEQGNYSNLKQHSEIRIQDDGKIILTHSLDLLIDQPNSAKGVGFSLPLTFQSGDKQFNLTYNLVYALKNGAKVAVVDQHKEAYKLIYLGDLKTYLPVGIHKFAFQVEISGYQFAQNGFQEFSWFPIRNYNAGIQSATLTFIPPTQFHPKLGQYFGLVWPKDQKSEPSPLTAEIGESSVDFILSNLAEGSHVQIIARWPLPKLAEPPKPASVKIPCSEFGPNFKWNTTVGKCEKKEG